MNRMALMAFAAIHLFCLLPFKIIHRKNPSGSTADLSRLNEPIGFVTEGPIKRLLSATDLKGPSGFLRVRTPKPVAKVANNPIIQNFR